MSGPLLRRQPCGYSRKRPFWVVNYGEVRGAVPDPDIKIKGGGGRAGHQDPQIRRGKVYTKFFSALQASVWSKNKGGASPPGSATGKVRLCQTQVVDLIDHLVEIKLAP